MEVEEMFAAIEILRRNLYDLVNRSVRLTDPQVVELSQKLDKLLSRAQELKKERPLIHCHYHLSLHNWALKRSMRNRRRSTGMIVGKKRTTVQKQPMSAIH